MPDSLGPALADLSNIACFLILLYGAYWSFAVRRALVGRIYRNHALWLGVLCVTMLFSVLRRTPVWPSSDNLFINLFLNVLANAPWPAMIVFALVDSTVPVARRSDPLLRSILHWEHTRIVIWSVLVANIVLSIYLEITSNFTNGSFQFSSGQWVAYIVGAPALLIGSRRSRDPVFRESLKWLGVAIVGLLGDLLITRVELVILNLSNYDVFSSYGRVPTLAVFFLFGYGLYRSARSLALVNRLPPI